MVVSSASVTQPAAKVQLDSVEAWKDQVRQVLVTMKLSHQPTIEGIEIVESGVVIAKLSNFDANHAYKLESAVRASSQHPSFFVLTCKPSSNANLLPSPESTMYGATSDSSTNILGTSVNLAEAVVPPRPQLKIHRPPPVKTETEFSLQYFANRLKPTWDTFITRYKDPKSKPPTILDINNLSVSENAQATPRSDKILNENELATLLKARADFFASALFEELDRCKAYLGKKIAEPADIGSKGLQISDDILKILNRKGSGHSSLKASFVKKWSEDLDKKEMSFSCFVETIVSIYKFNEKLSEAEDQKAQRIQVVATKSFEERGEEILKKFNELPSDILAKLKAIEKYAIHDAKFALTKTLYDKHKGKNLSSDFTSPDISYTSISSLKKAANKIEPLTEGIEDWKPLFSLVVDVLQHFNSENFRARPGKFPIGLSDAESAFLVKAAVIAARDEFIKVLKLGRSIAKNPWNELLKELDYRVEHDTSNSDNPVLYLRNHSVNYHTSYRLPGSSPSTNKYIPFTLALLSRIRESLSDKQPTKSLTQPPKFGT